MNKGNVITSLPGGFYDLIVYYGGSLLFLTIFTFSSFKLEEIEKFSSSLSTVEKIFLSVVIIFTSYILGLSSSTFSAHVIKKPVTFICKKFSFKSLSDYQFNFFSDCSEFSILNISGKSMKGNYWTLIYLIKLYKPEVADDLLKRYARCKLARNNAFNFFVLGIWSTINWLTIKAGLVSSSFFSLYYPPLIWSLIFFLISFIFTMEFYQRQIWFGDILVKIYAAFQVWLSHRANA